MIQPHQKHFRVLAISPSTRGFGFALLEGEQTLVDWGVKSVAGDKNTRCIAKLKQLMTYYEPDVLVLHSSETSYRSARIRGLSRGMITLASSRKIGIKVFSRDEVKRFFFRDGEGTKYAVAETLAKEFPDELGFRLPPKRRPWMSEDSRMTIFDAVSLALAFRLSREKKP